MNMKREVSKNFKLCKDCKFFKYGIPWEREDRCKRVRTVHWNYLGSWYEWGEPEKLNKGNKCTGYCRKWYK